MFYQGKCSEDFVNVTTERVSKVNLFGLALFIACIVWVHLEISISITVFL